MKISNLSHILLLLFIAFVLFTILFFLAHPIKETCICDKGWCSTNGTLNSFKYNDKIQIETIEDTNPLIKVNGYALKITQQTKHNKYFALSGD